MLNKVAFREFGAKIFFFNEKVEKSKECIFKVFIDTFIFFDDRVDGVRFKFDEVPCFHGVFIKAVSFMIEEVIFFMFTSYIPGGVHSARYPREPEIGDKEDVSEVGDIVFFFVHNVDPIATGFNFLDEDVIAVKVIMNHIKVVLHGVKSCDNLENSVTP